MIKVAVIGVGKMGMLHAGILNGLEGVALTAVSDTSGLLLGGMKSLKPELRVYEDYLAMLDKEDVNAVVIATPVFLHVEMAEACLKRGLPILLEKPLSHRAAEAEHLVPIAQEKGIVTQVGYMLRYVETFMKAKEIMDTGILGRVIHFRGTVYVSQLFRRGKGWRYDPQRSGGGVVSAQATHLIDLLYWYFGRAALVSGHTRAWYSEQVEDFAHAWIEFENGARGWIDSSWSMRHHRLMEVEINLSCEYGSLTVSDDSLKLFLDQKKGRFNAGWTSWRRPDLFEGVEIDLGGPQYTRQDKDFIRAIREGGSVESDLASSLEVQRIVDAFYRSADSQGKPACFST